MVESGVGEGSTFTLGVRVRCLRRQDGNDGSLYVPLVMKRTRPARLHDDCTRSGLPLRSSQGRCVVAGVSSWAATCYLLSNHATTELPPRVDVHQVFRLPTT